MEIYSEAVRCRLRSYRESAVTLSGGLDSGSVVVLASPEMKRKSRAIQAFSAVPKYAVTPYITSGKIGDETPYIEATRRFVGNINVTYLDAAHVTPLSGALRFLDLYGDPSINATNAHWIIALLEAAQAQGIGTLLTGQFDNATVSWNGDSAACLRGLMKARKWRDCWLELRALRASSGLWPAIRHGILRPWYSLAWIRRLRQFEGGRQPWRSYSPILPDFALKLELGHRMKEAGSDPTFSGWTDSHAHRYAMLGPGRTKSGSRWFDLGAGFGIEVRDPTADKRVLEFCLGFPESQFYRKGQTRWLVRRAFANRLPAEVLNTSCRSLQSADIGQPVAESRSEIAASLERIGSSPLVWEYLNLPYIQSIVDSVGRDAAQVPTTQVGTVLLRGLVVGVFLSQFESKRSLDSGPDSCLF